jgi:predicted  nucleic acid-binding Zn ribbon protein
MQGKDQNPESIKTCVHCGGEFQLKNGIKMRRSYYCGYCQTIMFGNPDLAWIPKLRRAETIPPGFHKIE